MNSLVRPRFLDTWTHPWHLQLWGFSEDLGGKNTYLNTFDGLSFSQLAYIRITKVAAGTPNIFRLHVPIAATKPKKSLLGLFGCCFWQALNDFTRLRKKREATGGNGASPVDDFPKNLHRWRISRLILAGSDSNCSRDFQGSLW